MPVCFTIVEYTTQLFCRDLISVTEQADRGATDRPAFPTEKIPSGYWCLAKPRTVQAADVMQRQAVQPEIAGLQGQMAIGDGGRGVEAGVAQHDPARLALAAAGRNDQRDARRQFAGPVHRTVAVDRPERPIFKAAGVGVAGEVEAVAGNDERRRAAFQCRTQRAGLGQQFGERPVLPGVAQGKRFRPTPGGGKSDQEIRAAGGCGVPAQAQARRMMRSVFASSTSAWVPSAAFPWARTAARTRSAASLSAMPASRRCTGMRRLR